jgi:hypothetical protein
MFIRKVSPLDAHCRGTVPTRPAAMISLPCEPWLIPDTPPPPPPPPARRGRSTRPPGFPRVTGITWEGKTRRWRIVLIRDGGPKYHGTFATHDEAVAKLIEITDNANQSGATGG